MYYFYVLFITDLFVLFMYIRIKYNANLKKDKRFKGQLRIKIKDYWKPVRVLLLYVNIYFFSF